MSSSTFHCCSYLSVVVCLLVGRWLKTMHHSENSHFCGSNVDYHSINYEAYYTSHIACQPHSYLNPNQTIVLTTLVCSMYTFLSVTLPLPPPPTDIQRTVGHCRVCQYSVGDPQDIGCKRCPGLHRPRSQTESFPQRVSNYGREREPQVVSK